MLHEERPRSLRNAVSTIQSGCLPSSYSSLYNKVDGQRKILTIIAETRRPSEDHAEDEIYDGAAPEALDDEGGEYPPRSCIFCTLREWIL